MEFVDDNKVKGEMSEGEFLAKIEEARVKRGKENYNGRDGNIEVYRESRTYRNIPYEISIVRYFVIGEPDAKGLNEIGKWACLEYPAKIKDFIGTVENIREKFDISNLYDILWADTLHSGQEYFTLKESVEWIENEAKRGIDALYLVKDSLERRLTKKVKNLKRLRKAFLCQFEKITQEGEK